MTPKECAELLNISQAHIHYLVKTHKLDIIPPKNPENKRRRYDIVENEKIELLLKQQKKKDIVVKHNQDCWTYRNDAMGKHCRFSLGREMIIDSAIANID